MGKPSINEAPILDITELLNRISKLEEASSILLKIIDNEAGKEDVQRFRELLREFVDDFNLSGPIARIIKLLPKTPLLPLPPMQLIKPILDEEGLRNIIDYLKKSSATLKLILQQSISQLNPANLASTASHASQQAVGRLFEMLAAIYLHRVEQWPELLPGELIPFTKVYNNRKSPSDLISISFAEPKMYAAIVQRSSKKNLMKKVGDFIETLSTLINDYAKFLKTRELGLKVHLHVGVLTFDSLPDEDKKEIEELVRSKLPELSGGLISRKKEKFIVEVFDLRGMKEKILKQKSSNPYANHLYATLKELRKVGMIEEDI